MHRLDLTVGTSSCGLTISDARAEDNGDWECSVIGLDFLGQNRYKVVWFPSWKILHLLFPRKFELYVAEPETDSENWRIVVLSNIRSAKLHEHNNRHSTKKIIIICKGKLVCTSVDWGSKILRERMRESRIPFLRYGKRAALEVSQCLCCTMRTRGGQGIVYTRIWRRR